MPPAFSRVSYRSSSDYPSDVVHGLHRLLSCSMLLTECQVLELKAKRRGGPKKVWVQYAVLDAAGKGITTHVLCFKTISVKNFSNKANIEQYQRNPFGSVKMDQSTTVAGSSLALVLSGGISGGKASNTVGVNIAGVQLDSHPRFVLSTGRGAEGARTTLQWFGSDATCRIQLQGVWIEHKELKVSFEQDDESEKGPIIEFASKYKVHYEARPGGVSDAASGAKVLDAPPIIAAPKVASVPKERSLTMSTRGARRLSALPPAIAPPAIAAALRKRQREETSTMPTLDSPVIPEEMRDEEEFQYPTVDNESHKRARAEAAVAAPSFGGYDDGYDNASVYGQDDMSVGSGSQPMLDVGDQDPSGVILDLEDDTDTSSNATGDVTPLTNSHTPAMATPFREGQEETAGNADFSATTAEMQVQVTESEADAQLRAMNDTFDEAEARHDKYEVQQQDPYTMALHSTMSKRASFDADVLPMQLATASAPGNPFAFTQFGSSSSPFMSMPQSISGITLSPPFGFHSAPMGSLGLDLPRSPFMLDQSAMMMDSPLPPLSLAGFPSSPMSPLLDCRSADHTPSRMRIASQMVSLSPVQRLTPLRTLSLNA